MVVPSGNRQFSIKAEFESEECFAPLRGEDAREEFLVFDGQEMRSVCPKCGGMIRNTEERGLEGLDLTLREDEEWSTCGDTRDLSP